MTKKKGSKKHSKKADPARTSNLKNNAKPIRKKVSKKTSISTKKIKTASTKKKYKPTGFQSTGQVISENDQSDDSDINDPYSHLEHEQDDADVMSIGDHLEELRKRIISIFITILLSSIIVGIFSPKIHEYLLNPFTILTGKNLIMSKAYGGLLVLMKLSVLTGTLISIPIIFYIIWGFITPAVTKKTKIIGNVVVAISSLLFWSGVLVCWVYIFPMSLKFLFVDFLLPGIDPIHPIEAYYGFLFMVHVGSGTTFQLPLVIVIFGAMGIVTMDWHSKYWKYILVGIFIMAAILTPPDPISQIILGTLLCIMYAVSVLIVYLIEKARRKKISNLE